jgi:hypothetical protein
MMVWNVTKDKITVRKCVYQESAWAPPLVRNVPVDRSIMITESDWLIKGALDMGDLITSIYDRANKKYGTNEKPGL